MRLKTERSSICSLDVFSLTCVSYYFQTSRQTMCARFDFITQALHTPRVMSIWACDVKDTKSEAT